MEIKATETAAALQADLNANAAQLADTLETLTPDLRAILDKFTQIDFRAKAADYGLEPDAKLTQKVALVVAVREILRQVEDLGSGLACMSGGYYIYSAGYWQELDKPSLEAFLTAAAVALGMKPNEAQHYKTQDELRFQFEKLAAWATPARCRRKVCVNFQNGTLDIENGRLQLREHRRADLLKYKLPYDYTPGATCPQFHKYLDRVLPDPDAQAVLAEFVGNTLAPSLNLQKVLVLQGGGGNGKSVFCDIVTALLGRTNLSSYSIASLTKEGSTSRFRLASVLLNYSSEGSLKMNSEAFKTLAAGEPIEARRLYGDSFIMTDYARLMFNCNLLPTDIEQSEGFFRRFLIIPFGVRITDAEKDPYLAARIAAAELPGVFNWVLAGLQRLLAQDRPAYTRCEAANRELENYKKESNSVLCFIEEAQLTPGEDPAEKEPLQKLFDAYRRYCGTNGYRYTKNARGLAKALRDQGFEQGRDGKRGTFFYCKLNRDPLEF